MKKTFLISVIFTTLLTFSTAYGFNRFHSNVNSRGLYNAYQDYTLLQNRMDKVIYLVEQHGDQAFNEISRMNKDNKNYGGIFIINPETGKLLVSPYKEADEEKALKSTHINGKAIALDVIKKWQKSRSSGTLEYLTNESNKIAQDYFADLAITNKGELYVVAIGKNDLNLQRLFVTKLIDKACNLMKEAGVEEAFKVFNNKDSLFRHQNTYIFVYDESGVCLLNPNFPDYVGKNIIKLNNDNSKLVKQFIEIAVKNGEGWVTSKIHKPEDTQKVTKDIFVQSTFLNGKTYIVGSGVYVEN